MSLHGLSVGIVADDLTGANDTALPFFLSGCHTRVLLGLVSPEVPSQAAHVWAINTNSRHVNPREAVSKVRQAIALLRDEYGVEIFYKKIDSTMRGPVAQECLAALDELKGACAVIVPAYPQQERKTVGGYHLVRGLPLERTEVALDPLYPVRQSHLPTLLALESKPEIVGHIALSTVMSGAGPLLKALKDSIEDGKKLVVVDACSDEDLDQIALALEKLRKSTVIVPCGSGGLAQALVRRWSPALTEGAAENVLPTLPSRPILIINGSKSQRTRIQLEKLIRHGDMGLEQAKIRVFELSMSVVLGEVSSQEIQQQVQEALGRGETVIVSPPFLHDVQGFDRPSNDAMAGPQSPEDRTSSHQVASAIEQLLSALAAQWVSAVPVHLVLLGGETSRHICHRLGIQTLSLQAEVSPAMPLLFTPRLDRWLVTKSGNFGHPLALVEAVEYLSDQG